MQMQLYEVMIQLAKTNTKAKYNPCIFKKQLRKANTQYKPSILKKTTNEKQKHQPYIRHVEAPE